MKKVYLLLLTLMLGSAGMAQNDVYLTINHKLGSTPFQMNTAAVNNNNVDFNVSRLEYYISNFTLIHDGGTETFIPGKWILVNAGSAMNELLGNFTFTSLEGIKFSVGVDSASNHLDPSSYAASHPLAPKSPSMHWGWSAGYRFVAMEGKGGSSLNQAFEIHALEDKNYFETTVMTSGSVTGQGITINIDADYAMAIRNIDVGAGVFNHGGNGEAKTLLENFRDYVFSPAGTSVGISQEVDATANKLVISPNPVSTTQTFTVSGNFPKGTTLSITDLTGRIVLKSVSTTDRYSLNIDAPGYYLVVARRQGKVLATGKLLIAQ